MVKPDGVFCSDECAEQFQKIHQTVQANDDLQHSMKHSGGHGIPKFVLPVFSLIIVLMIIYFVLKSMGVDLLTYIPF